MGAKIQAFDIFQTPLSSHYPLPLSQLHSLCRGCHWGCTWSRRPRSSRCTTSRRWTPKRIRDVYIFEKLTIYMWLLIAVRKDTSDTLGYTFSAYYLQYVLNVLKLSVHVKGEAWMCIIVLAKYSSVTTVYCSFIYLLIEDCPIGAEKTVLSTVEVTIMVDLDTK
jgi:hypothetical protein